MADDELEELREQTDHGSRLDTASDETNRTEFRESIAEHLSEIDAGERQKTLSAWDGPLAAFVAALEEDQHADRREAIADALGEELGVDVNDPKKSELLALTLRVGFQEVAGEDLEPLREALREDAAKGL
ncbi:hypothetical protein [Halorubrum halophilum]|uniref:hypothetical protein n=1 Tax=Halorubrum halophilum TaxID=413816 RepID=UPI000679CBEE|nr:hypothetical protein [Halorubrum halophilum]